MFLRGAETGALSESWLGDSWICHGPNDCSIRVKCDSAVRNVNATNHRSRGAISVHGHCIQFDGEGARSIQNAFKTPLTCITGSIACR